jgi:hypothetical protein
MATESELQTEVERLRQELAAVRREQQQAPGVDPGVAAYESQAAGTWSTLDGEIKRLEKEQVGLWEEGKFAEATAVQKQIALATTRQEQARQEWSRWNGMRAAPAVEQFLAANRGVYSPEEEKFVREHPGQPPSATRLVLACGCRELARAAL